jgi:beta-lactamase regulating signal transducer with metallopeptidase domain
VIQWPWWAQIVATLVHVDWRVLAILRAAVVVVLTTLVIRALSRSPAAQRHRVWLLTLALCCALPLASAWVAPAPGAPARVSTAAIPSPTLGPLKGTLLALWLAGAAAAIGRAAFGLALAARVRRRAERVTDDAWMTVVSEASAALGVNSAIDLRRTRDVAAPVTFGWLRPVVLLPLESREWSPARRRVVITHELAHVARRDWAVQLAERVVCALYWFHPLVRWAATRRRLEAERACDEAAVACGIARRDYASHLIALAERAPRRSPLEAMAFARPLASDLEERVRGILGVPPSPRHLRTLLVASGLVGAAGLSVVLSSPAPVCPLALKAARLAAVPAQAPTVPAPHPPLPRR